MTRFSALLLFVSIILCISCQENDQNSSFSTEKRPLRINVIPGSGEPQMLRSLGAEFTAKTGTEVEVVVGPASSSERLILYHQTFGARTNQLDIYELDIVWPGIFAHHLVDLAPLLEENQDQFADEFLHANTINGSLVSVPFFINTGILFYRPSLLEKYGFEKPPETWEELMEMSRAITEGQQAEGDPDFWAYAWQGAEYEGLTCNALEWIESEGGQFIDERRNSLIQSDEVSSAVQRAKSWIGTISSPDVTNWREGESIREFTNGNAAFLRAWPTSRPQMAKSAIRDDVAIAPLPAGKKQSAAIAGGWGLGISRYSPMRREAEEFVKFLISEEVIKKRTLEAGFLPPRTAVYQDPDVQKEMPWLTQYEDILPGVISRPSAQTGNRYGEVSAVFFSEIHAALQNEKEVDQALEQIDQKVTRFLD